MAVREKARSIVQNLNNIIYIDFLKLILFVVKNKIFDKQLIRLSY